VLGLKAWADKNVNLNASKKWARKALKHEMGHAKNEPYKPTFYMKSKNLWLIFRCHKKIVTLDVIKLL
jgi:hypothetical protein